MNGRQFIYHMHRFSPRPIRPPRRCWITSICRSTGRQDRTCSASTAPSPHAAHHGRHRYQSAAEGWVAEAAASATWSRSRSSIPRIRARERDGGGRRQKGAARPLQRDRVQLLGRSRNEMAKLQYEIDAKNLVGPRQPGRSGDGRAAWPTTPTLPSRSGGERRRVALCRRPLDQPDLLLLDEPTTPTSNAESG